VKYECECRIKLCECEWTVFEWGVALIEHECANELFEYRPKSQWRSQPAISVMLCNFHSLLLLIPSQVACFRGLRTQKYVHSVNELTG
jgi:hypothetical protein